MTSQEVFNEFERIFAIQEKEDYSDESMKLFDNFALSNQCREAICKYCFYDDDGHPFKSWSDCRAVSSFYREEDHDLGWLIQELYDDEGILESMFSDLIEELHNIDDDYEYSRLYMDADALGVEHLI